VIRFNLSRLWRLKLVHLLAPKPVFVSNTSPIPDCTDRPVSAWTCISQNLDTGFNEDAAGLAIPFAREQPGTAYRPTISILTTHTAAQLVA
jgi:hypothetical protein